MSDNGMDGGAALTATRKTYSRFKETEKYLFLSRHLYNIGKGIIINGNGLFPSYTAFIQYPKLSEMVTKEFLKVIQSQTDLESVQKFLSDSKDCNKAVSVSKKLKNIDINSAINKLVGNKPQVVTTTEQNACSKTTSDPPTTTPSARPNIESIDLPDAHESIHSKESYIKYTYITLRRVALKISPVLLLYLAKFIA